MSFDFPSAALPLRGRSSWCLLVVLVTAIQVAPLLPVAAQPSELYGHSAIYDEAGQRMVVYGGQTFTDSLWQLRLGAAPRWEGRVPGGRSPVSRLGHTAIYDPVRQRMVVFGGFPSHLIEAAADVWAVPLDTPAAWDSLQPSGTAPGPRYYHSAIYDPLRDRMVIFGGRRKDGFEYADVWSLWWLPTPRWEEMQPRGQALPPARPFKRRGHTAV